MHESILGLQTFVPIRPLDFIINPHKHSHTQKNESDIFVAPADVRGSQTFSTWDPKEKIWCLHRTQT